MSNSKLLRTIDRRNMLYGQYKYQVRITRIPGSNIEVRGKVRKWLRDQWGDPTLWVTVPINETSSSHYSQRNPRWTEVRQGRFQSPLIYIRDEADAMMFSLRWAG